MNFEFGANRSCWEWESKMRSIIAFIIFIFGCYYFEPYMIPGAALLILLKYYLVRTQANIITFVHQKFLFYAESP